ncbi:dermonecrotic toxin domain-containing protein [Pseudomonas sp. R2-60-08W]|uniref:dermonecrotic toxin domain-containing protein n=1 Tax=Pseudomonas sp. R2-60-08W TaxID=1173280 RepID=UPI000F572608|nr:DUF6543 domain-containing protein [Pseudomonas sp. R2-60-08W]AZF26376.1 Permease of the drug/metabolite transporter (DMT) superfamily [Pseudomonas sp. R2-60-08W]
MPTLDPPYFFEEFLRPVKRNTPTDRERELGFTVKELDWLHTLYYANDAARRDTKLKDPMLAESLQINLIGAPKIPLAGAFVLSPAPDTHKAVLYTPYGGMELFDSHAALLTEVQERLKQPSQRTELLRFLSISQRNSLPADAPLMLTSTVIPGAVMEHQQQVILDNQHSNVEAMLDQLRQLPNLYDMLDTLLGIMARTAFPGLNQGDTRVNFFSQAGTESDSRWVASLPLREALLQFYARQGWPAEQTHRYVNPRHDTSAFTQAQQDQDVQRWDNVVAQTSGILSKLLGSLLQTYWNEDAVSGQSRLAFFARVISDKFRADLLFKHQSSILSTEQSLALRALLLPTRAVRVASARPMRIEKVRVHALYQHQVELASTLMISNADAYLYTQTRGLQVLKDLDDLHATLLAMLKARGHEDELLNFLTVDEQNVFIGMDQIQVTGLPVADDLFQEMVEDIIIKQFDNMEHALRLFRRSGGTIDLGARLDSALDIRFMLDSRLLALSVDGRWSMHPVTGGDGGPTTVKAQQTRQHLQRLEAVQTALALRLSKHPTLHSLAAQALDAQLKSNHLEVQAEGVFINTYATSPQARERRTPLTSASMVEHLIARLARQTQALSPSPLAGFYGKRVAGAADKLNSLTVPLFNQVIERVLTTFAQHDLPALPGVFLDNERPPLSRGLLQGLSGEMQLRQLEKNLPAPALALLDSVLTGDSMTRLKRHGLNGFIPDAFGLSLYVGANIAPALLASCFVLSERGGLDPVHSGIAVLWSPRDGYEAFASIATLLNALTQRLADPTLRLLLLENLPISLRKPHQTYRLGPLQRIDDHLLNNRLGSYNQLMRAEIEHVLLMNLNPQALQNWLDALMRRAPPSGLHRGIAVAQAMLHQQGLPVWLGLAPPHEQILHAELLEQYRLSAPQQRDYLHGIMPMRVQAALRLYDLLTLRFPGQVVNPDNVLITLRTDLKGHTQTLTDFAMRHWPELRAEDIRPSSRTAQPLPPALDGSAVVQLVRQLDLNGLYQAHLTAHLGGQSNDALKRRDLFCRQLPWQMLQYAHQQRLDEQLSAAAWSVVQQVFDMPDALARAMIDGVTAVVRPLELIATAGATAANVLGCYLIGPEAGATGPTLLYAPYSPRHLLKEYPSESALLTEFTSPGALQDWLLSRLQAPHQATYRNLLGQQTLRDLSDIRLGYTPISGNLLTRLFADNLTQLSQMLACQFSRGAEAQWEAVKNLLSEGIPNALQFIAGKLAYPLVVWRSFELFKGSAEDLQQHRWQHALKTFIAGVAEMATLRKKLDGLLPDTATPPPSTTVEEWLATPAPPAMTLATLDMTAPLRTRLRVYEDTRVNLEDLKQSPLTHVYEDEAKNRHFIPVAGKVYPVKKAGQHWRMSVGDQHGPYVQRNARGEWVLDLNLHHPLYGKTLSKYIHRSFTRAAERQSINIEAVGMTAIAALSSWKAQCINEALNVATYYAVTCKRNLVNFGALRDPNSRLGRFFTEMFGVFALSAEQVRRIETRVDEVLNELVNPTLINPDSMRFVSGTHHPGEIDTFAFVLPDDADKKIYLLDRFFDPKMDAYQNRLTLPFDISAHARATVLIHEITHLRSLTEDLVYLDSMRPFPDLINVQIQGGALMKTDLTQLRETALSVMTPAMRLFKTLDEFTQQWNDFDSEEGTGPLKDKVLKTTGARTLADARSIFMSDANKRIDTILTNADSVAYLISHLGRELDPGA